MQRSGGEAQLQLTRAQARWLLANAFFINNRAPTHPDYGDISFEGLYTAGGGLAVQRLLCQVRPEA